MELQPGPVPPVQLIDTGTQPTLPVQVTYSCIAVRTVYVLNHIFLLNIWRTPQFYQRINKDS
jgi:hypothetical protein